MQKFNEWALGLWSSTLDQLTSEQFYLQICVVIVALALSWTLATYAAKNLKIFSEEPKPGSFQDIRAALFNARPLLQPLMAAIVLTVRINDLKHLDKVVKSVRGVKGVLDVARQGVSGESA